MVIWWICDIRYLPNWSWRTDLRHMWADVVDSFPRFRHSDLTDFRNVIYWYVSSSVFTLD